METGKIATTLRYLSVGSLLFGVLGGVFCWWVPLGMVLSLTGLVFGFIDCTRCVRRSLDFRLSIVAILISIATLAADIVVAYLGLQTVTFGGLR